LIAFILFVLAGGGASVAIRMTYAELAPFWVATARFGLGALAFWLMAAINKLPLPKGRAFWGAALYGTLTVGFAFILIAWGLVATPASTSQILMALVPLITLFLSAWQGVEKITQRGIIGSVLAVVGIAITMGGASTANLSIPHILAIILAAAIMAEGGVIVKRFPANPPIMTNAIAMTVGAIILAGASVISGEAWTLPTLARTWGALIYLVFFVTILTFLLYMFVLNNWTASGASYGFVMFPLVTIVVAATLAGEQITVNFLIGAALVLLGVLVGVLLPTKTKTAFEEECTERAVGVLPRCT
jgi:drug/metabolite transporter (DMT)-like permease